MNNKEFWKNIIYKDGKIDEEQVFRELEDYSFLMKQASLVYEEISGLGKTNYDADVIIGEMESRYWEKSIIQDDISTFLKDYSGSLQELQKTLINYFEIDDPE